MDQRKRQIGDVMNGKGKVWFVMHGKRIFDILISLQIGYLPKEKSRTLEKKKTASKEVDKRKAANWINGKLKVDNTHSLQHARRQMGRRIV